VTGELAVTLANNLEHYDALVPVINGKKQTLCTVFNKQIVHKIEECIQGERLAIKHLLEQVNVKYITEQDLQVYNDIDLERAFFNMNHPNEYEVAKKWAET
jgi:molybdenum cofactor guanylyltransferase